MAKNRYIFNGIVIITVVLSLLALPLTHLNWTTASAKRKTPFSPPTRTAGDPLDYYGETFNGVSPLVVFRFDQTGVYSLNALMAGGENARVLCWAYSRWSDTQVKNVRYNPLDGTITFKLNASPSLCALFPPE